jgi:hypothetical protein
MDQLNIIAARFVLNQLPPNEVRELATTFYGSAGADWDGQTLTLLHGGQWFKHSDCVVVGLARFYVNRWCQSHGWWMLSGNDRLTEWTGEACGVAHLATVEGRDNFSDSVFPDYWSCFLLNWH